MLYTLSIMELKKIELLRCRYVIVSIKIECSLCVFWMKIKGIESTTRSIVIYEMCSVCGKTYVIVR